MLTVPTELREALVVLRDHADSERVAATRRLPTLAQSVAGPPALRLVHWIGVEAGAEGRETGGHLWLEIDMLPTAAELDAAGVPGANAVPWLDAEARLELPDVDPVVAEASVMAGGRVTFSVPLTADQAASLAPLLERSGLTPLQVVWTGHVRVRMPPATVTASFDVTHLTTTTRRRGRTRIREVVKQHAVVEVEGADGESLGTALSQWALDTLTEKVEAGEEASVRASAGDVVSWPLMLPGTLEVAESQRTVTALILPLDQLESPPPVQVSARGPVGTEVERVDVEIRVDDGDAQTLALTDERVVALDEPGGELWSRHREVVSGRIGAWREWESHGHLRTVAIPVAPRPPREIEVLAGAIDLGGRWPSVRVVLAASDGWSEVVELDASTGSRHVSVPSPQADAELTAAITYASRDGVAIEEPPTVVEFDQVVLRDPMGNYEVSRTLLPVGQGWDTLELVMVDVQHDDGERTQRQTLELRTLTDLVTVRFPIRQGGPDLVRWRVHAFFTDGGYVREDWHAEDAGVMPRPTLLAILPPPREPD